MDSLTERCAIVVIGRNEGSRLGDTLRAAMASGVPVVYVDSRSSDGSVALARSVGVDVVETDPSEPLGAGRARNLGGRHVLARRDGTEYIQFIDGDCLLDAEWIPRAYEALESDPSFVAVCGWRLEARPRRNVFHRMAHLEWQMGSIGEVPDFAGEVMIRAASFEAVGGYDPRVVAGEDTELSSRLRQAGGRILRIDALCTLHDIDITKVREWWNRSERCGYGYAVIALLHRSTDQLFLREVIRTVLWGAVVPLAGLVMLRWSRWPLVLTGVRSVLSALRAARSVDPPGATWSDRMTYGVACAVGPIPGAVGVAKYVADGLRGRHPLLIEYKRAEEEALQHGDAGAVTSSS